MRHVLRIGAILLFFIPLFAAMKQAGRFAPGTRFQVCMPTPIGLLWSYIAPDYQRILERAMIERFLSVERTPFLHLSIE